MGAAGNEGFAAIDEGVEEHRNLGGKMNFSDKTCEVR